MRRKLCPRSLHDPSRERVVKARRKRDRKHCVNVEDIVGFYPGGKKKRRGILEVW